MNEIVEDEVIEMEVDYKGQFIEGGAVEIPTKTSDLENDSGFITLEDLPEGGNVDLSNYVTKDMMPEINFDDIFEPFTDKKEPFPIHTIPDYWIDNARIDVFGQVESAIYPTCVTDFISVIDNVFYEVEGDCYESEIYQYDSGGHYIGFTSVGVFVDDTYIVGKFKTLKGAASIRLVVPKFNDMEEEIDLTATIERFNNKFKLYYCDKYKLKDNVVLPDNVVIPTKTSELAGEVETHEEGSNILVFGGANE